MADPFEKLFGDTSELRVIQFLLPTREMSFNITEIAKGANISRQAAIPVVKKFLKWKILKVDSKHGNAYYYTLDKNSGFIETFEDLNNRIIEQMLGEEMLEQIASYSIERHVQIQPVDTPVQSPGEE